MTGPSGDGLGRGGDRISLGDADAIILGDEHGIVTDLTTTDIDGDGIGDILIAYRVNSPDGSPMPTRVHIFYGRAAFVGNFGLTESDAVLESEPIDSAHEATTVPIGDVDRDAITDALIGIWRAEGCARGRVYLLYGDRTRLSGRRPLDDVATAVFVPPDCRWVGATAALGDTDGDGYHDFLIASDAGSHVFYGRATRFAGELEITTASAATWLAASASHAPGDLDADTYDDVAVQVRPDESSSEVRIIAGRSERLAGVVDLASADGTTVGGVYVFPRLPLGDLDGDGYADVSFPVTTLGDPRHLLYYGGPALTGGATLFPVDAHAALVGEGDRLARVGGAGDMNGDAIPDLYAQTPFDGYGAIWLLPGVETRFAGEVLLAERAIAFLGLERDRAGEHAFAAGKDVNGDGLADVVVAANPEGDSLDPLSAPAPGRVYVILGERTGW